MGGGVGTTDQRSKPVTMASSALRMAPPAAPGIFDECKIDHLKNYL